MEQSPTASSYNVDVAIVGAGLSGLYLADRLLSSGRAKNILLLEANHRIGGRLFNQPAPASSSASSNYHQLVVEGGGQFIGGTHTRMLDLIQELGLETFSAKPPAGKFRWAQEILGPIRFGLCPDTSEPESFETLRRELEEQMASTIPLEEPWNAPNAKELDSQSFADFLATKPKSARIPYERLCTMHLGCDPQHVSLLYMLFLLKSTGGYKRFTEYENGAHQWRVKGGAYQTIERLVQRIGEDKIRLSSRVQEIVQGDGTDASVGAGVTIRGEGFTVSASHVVITLQPQLCSRIKFKPDLGPSRNTLHDEYLTRKPHVAKTHIIYDKPFWRDSGYSGTGVTSSGVVFIDNTPPDEKEHGVLLAFRDCRRSDLTHDKMVAYARTLFGPAAGTPVGIVEQDWSAQEQYSASCISHTPPNLLSSHGHALRKPVGRIHWAGAETSPVWPSFMEGAIHAANRVFDELAASN